MKKERTVTMRALVLENGGSIDGFVEKEIAIPKIKGDELLIKVHAVALNPSDYQTAEFLNGDNLNIVLGLDIAGEVVEVGEKVRKFKKGDRVFYIREINNTNGGFAEYAVSPERFACKVPDNLSDIEAAALPGAGFTAYHIMFQRFHLHDGKTILIHGGAGGVGSYAIQLAKLHQLKVLVTCLGRDKEYVHKLGADVAIDFQNEDVYMKINEETHNQGVDYIISTIGPEGATKDLDIMTFGAEIAVTAGLPNFEKWNFYDKGITVHEIALGNYLTYPNEKIQEVPAAIAKQLSQLVSGEKISIPKITVITLEEIPFWLKKMKMGEVVGKVVAEIKE